MRMSKRMMNETAKDYLACTNYEISQHRRKGKSAENELMVECLEDVKRMVVRSFVMIGVLTAEEAEESEKAKVTKAQYEAIKCKSSWLSAVAKVRGTQFAVSEE